MPGFPILHYPPESAQIHVHQVGNAIQPISSSVTLLFLPSIFQASGSFTMSQLFPSGGQSIGASASLSVLSVNSQGKFPLELDGLILLSKGLSRLFSNIINSLLLSLLMVQLVHLYVTTRQTIALTIWTFVSNVMSLLFNMLSRFVTAFLPRSKHLLTSLQSPSAVILEPKEMKSVTVSTFPPSICDEVIGLDTMILVF